MSEMKRIDIQFDIKHFEEIKQLPEFIPAPLYPKLSEIHPRCLGYIIENNICFFFLTKQNEDIIQELVNGFGNLKLHLGALHNFIVRANPSAEDIEKKMKPLRDFCDTMICLYKERKNE